jgi:hypothetical protein
MFRSKKLGLATIAISMVTVAAGQPKSYALADQADAIVVGEIQSGQQNGRNISLSLSVDRSLKGDAPPGGVLNISGSASSARNRDLKGAYGMFFLQKNGNSPWKLLPTAKGSLPFELNYFALPKNPAVTISIAATPSTVADQIAIELANGLQGYTSQLQLYQLAASLDAMPDSAVTATIAQSLRPSSDPELRCVALARLLRAGDSSALADVANMIQLLPQLTTSTLVKTAISGRRDSDPAAIANLGLISASTDVYMQRNAAFALMSIHTREALPFLASLLSSSDQNSREEAMRGFSRFVENLPIQTNSNTLNGQSVMPQGPTPFRTPETDRYSVSKRSLASATDSEGAFVQFWKNWWTTNRSNLGF